MAGVSRAAKYDYFDIFADLAPFRFETFKCKYAEGSNGRRKQNTNIPPILQLAIRDSLFSIIGMIYIDGIRLFGCH